MHVTLVHVFIKPEAISDFVEACRLNHEGSTAEPGNRRFDILQDATDPSHFVCQQAPMKPATLGLRSDHTQVIKI